MSSMKKGNFQAKELVVNIRKLPLLFSLLIALLLLLKPPQKWTPSLRRSGHNERRRFPHYEGI